MDERPEAAKSRLLLAASRHSRKLSSAKGGDDSETLSDISDAEICKYLNSKKEVQYKRIIWEAMNKDYLKGNNQKRAKTDKKADSTKKVVKPRVDNVKKPSSKINYDMLKKQNNEDEIDKISDGGETNSHLINIRSKNEESNFEADGSGDNTDDEFGHEYTGSEGNADAIQDYYGITDFGIEDDYVGYDEEYGCEEYK